MVDAQNPKVYSSNNAPLNTDYNIWIYSAIEAAILGASPLDFALYQPEPFPAGYVYEARIRTLDLSTQVSLKSIKFFQPALPASTVVVTPDENR